MGIDLVALIGGAALVSSATVLLVLALRRPVRAWLGAGAAYALWLCVPASLAAMALPRSAEVPLALPVAWNTAPAIVVGVLAEAQGGFDWRALLLPVWLAGALAGIALMAWQQWRFRRGLGRLARRDDGAYEASAAAAGLPAVYGLLRPRIVLPADFGRRYTVTEQALVLQHERIHVRRGDLFANALAAALRCVFWFNPLLAPAWRRFRHDQELACDERVIARNPSARRPYGEAMLKTQFADMPLPLGCHWQATHPLKERIDMLKRPTPSPLHWMAATFLALGLSASAGYAAWAAQPPQASAVPAGRDTATAYAIDVRLDVDGKSQAFQLHEQARKAFALRSENDRSPVWEAEFALEPMQDHQFVRIGGTVRADGKVISRPVLTMSLGKTATLQISTPDGHSIFTLELNARELDGALARLSGPAPATAAGKEHAVGAPVAAGTPADRQARDTGTAPGSAGGTEAFATDRLDSAAAAGGSAPYPLPPPHYPTEAAAQGITGQVMLLVTVAPDGSVRDAKVESATPPGVFDQVTLEAARQWHLKPAMKDGKPVEGRVRIPVTFSSDPPAQEMDGA